MQARELDGMWEDFDTSAMAERLAHARTVQRVAVLLEHLPAAAVASGIVERCQVTYATARALVAEADELRGGLRSPEPTRRAGCPPTRWLPRGCWRRLRRNARGSRLCTSTWTGS